MTLPLPLLFLYNLAISYFRSSVSVFSYHHQLWFCLWASYSIFTFLYWDTFSKYDNVSYVMVHIDSCSENNKKYVYYKGFLENNSSLDTYLHDIIVIFKPISMWHCQITSRSSFWLSNKIYLILSLS